MFDSYKTSDMKLHFVLEEAILAIVVQVIGMFLILSSVGMFVKHASLHKLENVLQINLLFSSGVFLIIDWILTLPGTLGCELFSSVFIIFGTVCTYTTAGIALLRYKKMMQISMPMSGKISSVLSIIVIWLISILCMLYPAIVCAMDIIQSKKDTDDPHPVPVSNNTGNKGTMCFFNDGVLYRNPLPSVCFAFVGIIFPIFIMVFAYTKIYKKVRKARINRWLNHMAMQRSQQTEVIHLHGRKANVFQLSSKRQSRCSFNSSMQNQPNYRQERSVLTKGTFAVLIVMLCWIPFCSTWMYLAFGFNVEYMIFFRYLMIIAKFSVILNVSHYICFNTKYRNLYKQTAFAPFSNVLRLLQTDAAEENTSRIDSQIVPYSLPNVQDTTSIPLQPFKELTPIHETHDPNIVQPLEKSSDKKSQPRRLSRISQWFRLQRSTSMPEKIRRISRKVHPHPIRQQLDLRM